MGLFGSFGGKKQAPSDGEIWYTVASKIASLLEALMQSNPQMLADPYARVMLRDDWSVYVAADKRDPEKILGRTPCDVLPVARGPSSSVELGE